MASSDTALPSGVVVREAAQSYLAKVYKLGENDQAWQDCGVVRVRCSFVEHLNDMALVMLPEDEPTRVVLETPLSHCEFRRDVPTIISWVDTLEQFQSNSEFGHASSGALHEVALSFETSEGCAKIWEEICTIQGRFIGDYRVEEFRNGGDHEDTGGYSYDPSQMSHGSEEMHGGNAILQSLPPFTRSNLESIVRALRGFSPTFKARFGQELAHVSGSNGQNGQSNGQNGEGSRLTLQAVFQMYEEIEAEPNVDNQARRKEELNLIFELVKSIALLDDRRILEILVEDDCFERLAGCFEHDPTLASKPNHRNFLRSEVRLVQVVPITNSRVLTMISHRFRLIFLRDVLLARVTDEMSQKRLSGFEKQLGGDIAQMLSQDKEYVARLFELLEGPARPERAKAIELMLELCKPTVDMQMPARNAIYRTYLENNRILHVCEKLLADPQSLARERIDIQEVLFFFLKHDPTTMREYILECENKPENSENGKKISLLALLVEAILDGEHAGVPAQAAKLLTTLLDPESFVASPVHSEPADDPFIAIFYKKYFDRLLTALDCPSQADKTPEDPAHLVCDLILYFVQNHGFLVRDVILKHDVLPKVLRLVDRREKHLVLDAIRLVRVCIGLKEKFFVDYIIEKNLLEPIVRNFKRNGMKNNLINSATIEMFECIKDSKEAIMNPLVDYVVTSFAQELRPMRAYASTFEELERKHQESKNGVRSPPTPHSPPSSAESSMDGLAKRSSLFRRGNPSRLTASTIFGGELRNFRVQRDDDDALFDDDVSSAASAPNDDPTPPKRARLDADADNKHGSLASGAQASAAAAASVPAETSPIAD
jgi:protein phosphatase-4 regulatory subunit 3